MGIMAVVNGEIFLDTSKHDEQNYYEEQYDDNYYEEYTDDFEEHALRLENTGL